MASKRYLENNLFALILAGGAGSRLWPFSRELQPKQLINIIGNESLLQNTISRVKGAICSRQIYIITNRSYYYEVKKQIAKFKIPDANIILEPEGKNTAPAIGLGARLISRINPDAILLALPSDHYIKDIAKFRRYLKKAIVYAEKNFLVTIGVKPTNAETGYGYIKISRKMQAASVQSSGYKVERFIEKPSLKAAKKYIASNKYFWNGGMFVWKASVFMEEVKRYLPNLHSQLLSIRAQNDIARVWPKIKPISVDYGVMEHSKKIVLIPANFYWTDLGSWDALDEVLPKDRFGNIILADLLDCDSKGICAFSRGNRLIATVGLKDLIIVDTPDALLVCNRHKAQDVKKIVEKLKSNKRKEHIVHMTDKRPWGSYTILQVGNGFKIKLVEIDPKKRLSLQSHRKRAEHWVVVSGSAKVTYGKTIKFVRSNQSIYIPRGMIHRLENPVTRPLKIVEVQTGSYLEEDDIKRLEDDFQRR